MALAMLLGERGGALGGGDAGGPGFGDGGGPFGSRPGALGLGASLRSLVGAPAKLPPIRPAWDLRGADRLEESPAAAPRRLLGQPLPLAGAGDALLSGPPLPAARREDFFGALDFGGPGGAAASTAPGPAGQVAGDGAAERASSTPGAFRLQDSPTLDGQTTAETAIAEAMEARLEAAAMASAMLSSSSTFGLRDGAALAQAEHAIEGSRSHADGHIVGAVPLPDPVAEPPGEAAWLHSEGPAVSAAPQSALSVVDEATDAAEAGMPEPVATVVPPQVRARTEMRKLFSSSSSSLDGRASPQDPAWMPEPVAAAREPVAGRAWMPDPVTAASLGEPVAVPAAAELLHPRRTSSLSPAAATRLPHAALYTPGTPPQAAPAFAAATAVAAPTAIMPLGSTAVVPAGYQITVAQDGAHVAPARIIAASTALEGASAGCRLVTREEMARNGHCVEHGGAVANSELLRDRAEPSAPALRPPAGLPPAQLIQSPAAGLQPVAGTPPLWHPRGDAGMPPPWHPGGTPGWDAGMHLPARGVMAPPGMLGMPGMPGMPPGMPGMPPWMPGMPPGMPGMPLPGPPPGGLLPPPMQQLPPGVSMVPMPQLSVPPGAAPPFMPPGVAPVPGVSFVPPGAGKPFTILSAMPQGMPHPLAGAAGQIHEEHKEGAHPVEAPSGKSPPAPEPQPEMLPTFGLAQAHAPGGPPAAGPPGSMTRPGALPERHPPPWQGCFPTLAPEAGVPAHAWPPRAPLPPPEAPGGVLDASAHGAAAQPSYKYGPDGEPLPAPMSSMDHVLDHAEQQLASRASAPPRGEPRPAAGAPGAPVVSQFAPAGQGAPQGSDAAGPAGGVAPQQQSPAPRAKRQADYGYGPAVQAGPAPAPLLPLGPPGGVAAGSGTSLGSPEPHGRVDSQDPSIMYV
ncbi:unnamed protein product [Prorocentrum cordatum]|uniref:Uncharacterized protein n=1 Tax=Prorocentrum cordatum TaxID=2364126 RepID=A0ABN9ULH0_9DINO|nr:unnamed protein product [Polarella glacialis]